MITGRRVLLVLMSGVAACATPGQVRRVETQVLVGQAEQRRADSARSAELVKLLGQQQRMMDSMLSLSRALDERLSQSDRNTQAAFEDVRRDISVLAQATNVSTQKLAQIRTDMEARLAAAGGDNSAAAASDETIYAAATAEYNAGRMQTARDAYHDLINNHPTSPLVPTALIRIGTTFEATQADSARAYYTMVLKLPKSTATPTALYKLAGLEEKQGNTDAAQGYYKQIVSDFPNSLEYANALAKIRKP